MRIKEYGERLQFSVYGSSCVCTLGNERSTYTRIHVALDGETRERKGGKQRERERHRETEGVGVRRREVGR